MIAVGKGDVQVAQMLRKPWVCLMKQKGQPWEGRSCPSRFAQGCWRAEGCGVCEAEWRTVVWQFPALLGVCKESVRPQHLRTMCLLLGLGDRHNQGDKDLDFLCDFHLC